MGLEADDGRLETSPPLRRGVQTADRAVARERQAIPEDQGRVRHRAIDPAALGPRHPRPAVGDGGGRFRTSGAGIHTKAGVIRANAARYRRDAGCWVSPLHLLLGWPGVPGWSVWIRSPATCARSGATAADAPAPGRSRLPWKGGASPRPGDASAASCANRVCGRVHAQTIQTARNAGQRGEAREPAGPRVRRLRPAHASRERSCLCLRRRTGC